MKEIKVVIGANFGDEAKGKMTNYFAFQAKNSIVVRFNGGAQAGHTVVTPEGKRHVFGHFGSGTLEGIPTYLGPQFVINPMLFVEEYRKLILTSPLLAGEIKVYVDANCLVTTPYDMMINQIIEMHRGSNRHGSCGVGFGETIERSLDRDLKITYRDLTDTAWLDKLNYIREIYVHDRLKALGIDKVPDNFLRYFESDGIVDHYMHNVQFLLNRTEVFKSFDNFDSIIFEGAQGLLLDQDHEWFPHVTRSHTGMKNVVSILKQEGLQDNLIDICYLTRTYLTRHGAGPFPTEVEGKPFELIEDTTNIPNEFQGTLRFGLLDLDLLGKTILNDLKHAEELKYTYSLAISCMDQLGDRISFHANGKKKTEDVETFLGYAWDLIGTVRMYLGFGPTRRDITRIP